MKGQTTEVALIATRQASGLAPDNPCRFGQIFRCVDIEKRIMGIGGPAYFSSFGFAGKILDPAQALACNQIFKRLGQSRGPNPREVVVLTLTCGDGGPSDFTAIEQALNKIKGNQGRI